jgi:hypothetical protein
MLVLLLGLVPAFIARTKGRSFGGWWLFGVLVLIVALPCSILIGPAGGMVRCQSCARAISRRAASCPGCGHPMPVADTWRTVAASPQPRAPAPRFFIPGAVCLIVGLVIVIPFTGILHGAKPNHATSATNQPEPEKQKAEEHQPEPEKQQARSKRQPVPAVQVCGPDHWVKDHWEPSCR